MFMIWHNYQIIFREVTLVINFCSILQQESAKCVFVFHGHITAVRSLSFCPNGLALVSGGIGGLLNIWSLQVSKTLII